MSHRFENNERWRFERGYEMLNKLRVIWLFILGVDVGLFTGLALLDC